ncbi:HRDC-like protein [Sparassis latifolia]|uniref:DNA-directed RNA polymerase III subunit RPC9 n=1 Tax=Sparassis crispa TaxID=139825 RepID=A0A401GSB0_9APHY|nr:DNA-directed RNA polymerase III subunit RPC9 [Sparassis crispa]GBE85097.1 DNA-directed RNA polymerase III subunit RPC9 [Sparassis crispa]
MEVLNQRAALLSNYEVLTLLRELESDHLARTKTALRIKKEEEAAGNLATKTQAPVEEICENLRTIEVEAIQYLSADYQPTSSQTDAGIVQLTRALSTYELTKAEKLQIVNLAPTEPVELYVIVEELEDRFEDKMEEMLGKVRSSLTEPAVAAMNDHAHGGPRTNGDTMHRAADAQVYGKDDGTWDYDENEMLFDDTGEGHGVEGDLDVEDD